MIDMEWSNITSLIDENLLSGHFFLIDYNSQNFDFMKKLVFIYIYIF